MSNLRVLGKEHEQESSWNIFFFKAVLNIILLASKKRGRNKVLYSYRNVGNSHCCRSAYRGHSCIALHSNSPAWDRYFSSCSLCSG